MPKKKHEAKNKKFITSIFFATIFFGAIFSGVYYSLNFKKIPTQNIETKIQKPQKESSNSVKIASSRATPKQILTASQSNNSSGIPILLYHYVANNPNPKDTQRDTLSVSPDKFDAEMDYLSRNGYTPVTLDTLYGIYNKQTIAPSKPVVLTFDDGYIDFYTNVYPTLRKYNFHAVSFIPTGLIGGSYYMNWNQIREIQSSGLVTFEDHTVTHANLAGLSYAAALKQMVDSKNTLQSQTGYPVNFIAYPYGISDGFVQAVAKQAGFVGGLGTWYGKAWGPGMNMPRIKVSGAWNLGEFASRL